MFGEDEGGRVELERFVEPLAQRHREISHLRPSADAFFIKPIQNLPRAKSRMTMLGEQQGEGFERFAVEGALGGGHHDSRGLRWSEPAGKR